MNIRHKTDIPASVVAIRLGPGTDVIDGIEDTCQRIPVRSGIVSCCFGSLQNASFCIGVPMDNKAGVGYSDPKSVKGPIAILSAQGTIGLEKNGNLFTHVHAVLGDKTGKIFGGHLVKGTCPVLVTCEIMIHAYDTIRLRRTYDPEVDFEVLMPS